jgi:hypothetical protein
VSYENRSTLFIFLDESGNLDFSRTGSRFWSLSALCTFEPVPGRESLIDLHYQMADSGNGQECFHATEDSQAIRDAVFQRIMQLPDNFEVHSVIAEKNKANPSLYTKNKTKKGIPVAIREASSFYDRVCRTLLQYIFNRPGYGHAEKIIVVLSSLFTNDKHHAIMGTLKSYLKGRSTTPFEIYFHSTKADINCQIADYCGWAVTILWERGERRSLTIIKDRVKSQYPIFENGTKTYY